MNEIKTKEIDTNSRQCDAVHTCAGIDFNDPDPEAGWIAIQTPCAKPARWRCGPAGWRYCDEHINEIAEGGDYMGDYEEF